MHDSTVGRRVACRYASLGSEARLNTPSHKEGNYHWRYQPGSLTRNLSEKLAALAEVTDRLPQPVPLPKEEDFAA